LVLPLLAVLLPALLAPAAAQAALKLTKVSIGRDSRLPEGQRVGAALAVDEVGFQRSLLVWVFDQRTGARVGSLLPIPLPSTGAPPVDVLYSQVFRPGRALVLDADLNVHEFTLTFEADGSPALVSAVVRPIGSAGGFGRATALAELEHPPDPQHPPDPARRWLGIGTASGNLVLAAFNSAGGLVTRTVALGETVHDVAVVPQVGSWAFAALTSLKLEQFLVGVMAPPDDSAPAEVVFVLHPPDPQHPPDPALLALAGQLPPDDGMPLTEPLAVNLVAANGTRLVYRLTVPPDPQLETSFNLAALDATQVAIADLAVGSLALVPADGGGLLYDPGFNLDQGGVSGTLLTLFGASLELSPKTLKLSRPGRWVTAVFELENNGAAAIDPRSLELLVGSGFVRPAEEFAPQLGDADGDANADWTLKFDRAAVQSLIPSGATEVTVTARLPDGTSASALLRIVP
jgi:hypothetical protein